MLAPLPRALLELAVEAVEVSNNQHEIGELRQTARAAGASDLEARLEALGAQHSESAFVTAPCVALAPGGVPPAVLEQAGLGDRHPFDLVADCVRGDDDAAWAACNGQEDIGHVLATWTVLGRGPALEARRPALTHPMGLEHLALVEACEQLRSGRGEEAAAFVATAMANRRFLLPLARAAAGYVPWGGYPYWDYY